MDFMNLNQAAHGDREFGYIQTRLGVARKTVAGHVSDPRVTARVGAWARAALGLVGDAVAAAGPLRRQHARRRGDRGRQGRGGAAVRGLGQHLRRQRPGRGRSTRSPTRRWTTWSRSTRTPTASTRELRPGGERHDSLRYAARLELGLRAFLDAGGFRAFTTNFEDLGGLRQLPGIAVQRLMADGYGFGGEGDWKTSVLVRTLKAMAVGRDGRHLVHGGLHLRPDPGRGAGARRPHARGLPDDRRRHARRARSTRWASAAGRTRSGWCSTPHPARRWCSASPTWGSGSGWWPTRSTWWRRRSRCAELPVARAVWRPRPDLPVSAEAWITAGAPAPHRAVAGGGRRRSCTTWPR